MILADLNEHALEGVARESKTYATNARYQTLCLRVDILSEKDLQSMVDAAITKFGRIDYFVQAAGVVHNAPERKQRVTYLTLRRLTAGTTKTLRVSQFPIMIPA